uniref:Vesicle transport protein n=1 Tax=Lactuca sativa TaxID=4236 RepID=A0A9R1VYE1_LACSA|nr:hypothetical protein LSAT_V11C400174900 [Lactuca sativa]
MLSGGPTRRVHEPTRRVGSNSSLFRHGLAESPDGIAESDGQTAPNSFFQLLLQSIQVHDAMQPKWTMPGRLAIPLKMDGYLDALVGVGDLSCLHCYHCVSTSHGACSSEVCYMFYYLMCPHNRFLFSLKGYRTQFVHMTSKERLPITLGFIGSILGTIYVSMVLQIYLSTSKGVISLSYYAISYFPGGSASLKFFTSAITSSILRCFGSFQETKIQNSLCWRKEYELKVANLLDIYPLSFTIKVDYNSSFPLLILTH